MRVTLAVVLGFALDALIGDPPGLWHPVCAIGRLIAALERVLRRLFPATPAGETAAGVVLWVLTVGTSFAVPAALLWGLSRVSPLLAFVCETVLCGQIFARRCLADAGRDVFDALGRSLEAGRQAVAMYVGRDTAALDETGVIRATVETIAENTTDGVIAPMLFLLVGGAPLGLAYKAVNTLDSMVGYHNEKYEYFGKFSAKMDDICNFIPARLAAACMIAGAGAVGEDNRNALRVFRRDRACHKSPNAGQTESVCAGALHVQLAGDAVYFGRTVHKDTLGDADRPVVRGDIGRAARLMSAASLLALAVLSAVRLLLSVTPL